MTICADCKDSHKMEVERNGEGFTWPCTYCPVPCRKCASRGTRAYCAETPCSCSCHEGSHWYLTTKKSEPPKQTKWNDPSFGAAFELLRNLDSTANALTQQVTRLQAAHAELINSILEIVKDNGKLPPTAGAWFALVTKVRKQKEDLNLHTYNK